MYSQTYLIPEYFCVMYLFWEQSLIRQLGKLVIMVEPFTNCSQITLYYPASVTGAFLLPAGTMLNFVSRGHWTVCIESIFIFTSRFQCIPQDSSVAKNIQWCSLSFPCKLRLQWGKRRTKGTNWVWAMPWILGLRHLSRSTPKPNSSSIEFKFHHAHRWFPSEFHRMATQCDREFFQICSFLGCSAIIPKCRCYYFYNQEKSKTKLLNFWNKIMWVFLVLFK